MTESKTTSADALSNAIDDATRAALVQTASIGRLDRSNGGGEALGFEHLLDVPVQVTVEIGRARVPLEELARLAPGSILRLDRAAHDPCDVLVGGKLVARGEIVTVDDHYGVRITSVAG